MRVSFQELPVGAIFRSRPKDVRYQKIVPIQVGPQVFRAALVNAADEILVFEDDAGPGPPHDRVPPYIPRGPDGRALVSGGGYVLPLEPPQQQETTS